MARRPDLVSAARALGLPGIVKFTGAAAGFLASAFRQPAEHAAAFGYVLFQRGRRDEWPESRVRSFRGEYTTPEAGDGTAAPADGVAEPLALEWGPGGGGAGEGGAAAGDEPGAAAAAALWATDGAAERPVRFRGLLESGEDKAGFRFGLFFHHFFSARRLVAFSQRLCGEVEPPDAALFGAVAEQFPSLTGVARRLFATGSAVAFGDPSGDGAVRVELGVPLAREQIKRWYPDLLAFLDRIALLEVTLLSEDGTRAVCFWSLSGKTNMFHFCAYKRGENVLWADPASLAPGRGRADAPLSPELPFDFDLGAECRRHGAMRAHVRLSASFCGIAFALPQLDVRLAVDREAELTASLSAIERTMATTAGTFVLGIKSIFDDLVETLRVRLALMPQGGGGGGGGGTSLAVDAKVTMPRSFVLAAYVGRRIEHYTRRWMAWLAVFRDVCEAVGEDAARHAAAGAAAAAP